MALDETLSSEAEVRLNAFQLCLFKPGAPPRQHALGFMHKHELAFQALSSHNQSKSK